MFAIIKIGASQHKVTKGDKVQVEHIDAKEGETLTFSDVLLTHDDGKTNVGTPHVPGVSVKAKVLSHEKGDKLHVYRFRAKSRYRRKTGFRPQLTTLEILSVGRQTKSKSANAKKSAKK